MFAVIQLPEFELQAALRPEPALPTQAVALVDVELKKPVLWQVNAAARHSGVVEGLTPSQAMARCPSLLIKHRSHFLETATTLVLLQTAHAFSPYVEDTGSGVCTVDLKGLPLPDAEAIRSWSDQLAQSLIRLNLTARVGVAPTPALALIAAHQASLVLKDVAEFVAALPLDVLQPSADILQILVRWGVRSVGAFLGLGRAQVAERLGTAALELFDRVSPEAIRPLRLMVPSEEFVEAIEFEQEVETIEPLLFVLRRFVEQLALRVELQHRVIATLELELGLASGTPHQRVFKIPAPTASVTTLFRTLHTHLESLRTESPIVSVQLAATPALPEKHQFGLFEATLRDPNQFAETLSRLTALCGADRVGNPVLEATHRPDSFRLQTPDFSHQTVKKTQASPLGLQLRRYRPALPAGIEFHGETPAVIRSQVFNGFINEAQGPFRSSGNWWDSACWTREEWDVQTSDGRLYRVFRSPDGCFVEGRYD